MKKLLTFLALIAYPAYAAEVCITEECCPSQILTDDPVLACVTVAPPPDPDPPPPGSACANAPVIPSRNFQWDCGGVFTSVQTPSPGFWRHVIGEVGGYMSPQLTCIRSNLSDVENIGSANSPVNVVIRAIDQVYYNQEHFYGDVIFQDSARVQWINAGGSVAGNIVLNNSSDIEVDGECQ